MPWRRRARRWRLTRGKTRYADAFEDEIVFRMVDSPDQQKVTGELVEREPDDDEDDESVADDPRRQGMLELLAGEGLSSEQLYAAMSRQFKCGRTATLRLRNELQAEGAVVQRDGV